MFGIKKTPAPVEPVAEIIPEPVKAEPEVKEFVPADTTLIGEGITMIGDFESKDPIIINGTLQGNISSTNHLNISETGSMTGEGETASVKIEGAMEGKLVIQKDTYFTSTGHMVGNLKTATLKTDDGSEFVGELKLIKNFGKAEAVPAAEAPAEEKAAE